MAPNQLGQVVSFGRGTWHSSHPSPRRYACFICRICVLIILVLLAPSAFSQDKWSLETSWETTWGETGPGIYADSTGKLRLHKRENRKSSYFCESEALSEQEIDALRRAIAGIPPDLPLFSNLYIADGCSDEEEMTLTVDLNGKWRLFHFTKIQECRWEEATPSWLTALDDLLRAIYSRVEGCE